MTLLHMSLPVFVLVLSGWLQSTPPITVDVRIPTGGIELAATLTLPPGIGPHPAVVLLSGSGPSTRRELQKFVDLFVARGFATLVYDKRGVGASTGATPRQVEMFMHGEALTRANVSPEDRQKAEGLLTMYFELAAERWSAGLKRAGNTRARVVMIDGMGHAATIGSTHAQGGVVMPDYVTALAEFLATLK